jgi:hypothetical protein
MPSNYKYWKRVINYKHLSNYEAYVEYVYWNIRQKLKSSKVLLATGIPLFFLAINVVTDLIRALPGNGSVNSPTYTVGQQYSGGVF